MNISTIDSLFVKWQSCALGEAQRENDERDERVRREQEAKVAADQQHQALVKECKELMENINKMLSDMFSARSRFSGFINEMLEKDHCQPLTTGFRSGHISVIDIGDLEKRQSPHGGGERVFKLALGICYVSREDLFKDFLRPLILVYSSAHERGGYLERREEYDYGSEDLKELLSELQTPEEFIQHFMIYHRQYLLTKDIPKPTEDY